MYSNTVIIVCAMRIPTFRTAFRRGAEKESLRKVKPREKYLQLAGGKHPLPIGWATATAICLCKVT